MIVEEASMTSDCVEGSTGACAGESFFAEIEGKRYCVLHFPSPEKKAAFDTAISKKLKGQDSNYGKVWFPGGDWFSERTIAQSLTFEKAVFDEAVSFNDAIFKSEVDFRGAIFNGNASFKRTKFQHSAVFVEGEFAMNADFFDARFNAEANFSGRTFKGWTSFGCAEFHYAVFWPSIFSRGSNLR
jgi:uncharacterized protein YjbI with pentapeptide repeats